MRNTSESSRPLDAGAAAIFAVGAASALMLGWSAALCVPASRFHDAPPVEHFTIAVSASADSAGNATMISRLLADGRELRGADAATTGKWVSYWNRALSHPDTAEPASLSFDAQRMVAAIDRKGHCGHISINVSGGPLWKDSCDGGKQVLVLDLPASSSRPRWSYVLWSAAFLTLFGIVGAWRNRPRRELWLAIYLSTLHLLFWLTQPVGLLTDSINQMTTLALNARGLPGYFPPGYPALVGAGYLISRTHAGSIVTVVQHAMTIAAILWCYRMLARCTGAAFAFAVAIVTGAAAPTLALPQALLSENVALFGMAGALYFAMVYRERGQPYAGIGAGVLLGWAGLARIVPLAAGLPAIFAIVTDGGAPGGRLRRFGIVGAASAAVIAIPMLWFAVWSGGVALSNSIGRHLYNRAISDQRLIDPDGPAMTRLTALIAPLDPGGVPHWRIQKLLSQRGLTSQQVEVLMKRAALEGIRMAPFRYLVYSFRQSWKQYFLDPLSFMPYAANPFDYPIELEPAPPLGASANSLRWRMRLERAFAAAWPCVAWLALASLPLMGLLREKATFAALAIVPAGYIVATALVEYLLSRYNAAIVPFVFMLAGGAICALLRAVASRRER